MSTRLPLRMEDLASDPIDQFQVWFAAARDAQVSQPEAVAVATATPDGRPSVRMVLVKAVDERGFVFFTNYDSRKGAELAANPYAGLLFHWEPLERQVRIQGPVQRTTREQSLAYAHSRGRASQLSALASRQSQPVADRAMLEARVAQLGAQHPGEIPLSDHWGGFRVIPERIEFWQGGAARLHDRFVYEPDVDGGWAITRLQP